MTDHDDSTDRAGAAPMRAGSGRRRLLAAALAASGGLLAARALGAARLAPTPRQGEGPFYPRTLPLDDDNDLVTVRGQARRALGTVTHVHGRVLDATGAPVRGARVEIWQCDANGRYHHPGDRRSGALDEGFQGFGHFVTSPEGGYRFRTIRPVPYPGRAPHIHFAVVARGHPRLVTQMYVAGAPENARDGLLNAVRDPAARARLVVDLTAGGDAPDELEGRFDIVLEG